MTDRERIRQLEQQLATWDDDHHADGTAKIIALYELAQLYRDLQQCDQAQRTLEQAISIAQTHQDQTQLAQGYWLRSALYEQTGDSAQALAYFKRYHEAKTRGFLIAADARWQRRQATFEEATARHTAEIAHRRAVELQQEIAEDAQLRLQLQHQLASMRALSEFKQTLLASAETEADSHQILAEALQHLLAPLQARMLVIHQNKVDPILGHYGAMIVTVTADASFSMQTADAYQAMRAEYCGFLKEQTPGLAAHSDAFIASTFPHSFIPVEVNQQLRAGKWVGGRIADLFAGAPAFGEFLVQKLKLGALLSFPIHIDNQWWGMITLSEWAGRPSSVTADLMDPSTEQQVFWSEDEILLLRTATEMVASTLQRWQAQANLRALNDQLEQQVEERTAELRDTVARLHIEIEERQHAEGALQTLMTSLEHRLADRTQELATFFDLTVLGGRSANFRDVLETALPRMLEVTHSQAICIHLLDTERSSLLLAAQQNLPQAWCMPLQKVALSPPFQDWLQQPPHSLLTTALTQRELLPLAFQLTEFQTYLGVPIRVAQQTEGILSCYRFTERAFSLDDIALVTAIGAQMGIVIETHRLRKQAAELAVLEERQRLARDLHDSVTQSLYSLSLFSRAGREAVVDGDMERLQRSLTQVESTTLHALREMRLLLYELRPADLEQEGLKRAVELRLNTVERRVGLQVAAQIDEIRGLAHIYEIELYYIIIEAMNNIVRHAAASRLTLQLIQENEQLHLQIVDNGLGFDPVRSTGGLGLRNIRERVNRLGGSLEIFSEPGRGARLEVLIPHRRGET